MNNRGQNVNLNGTSQNHHPNQGYPQQNNQYQGNGYNGQNSQYNNQQYQGYNNNQNPQYRGQGYNGQNPQFGSPNNPQFSNQNGYNNPNQFNPQFGNNQNFKPMNRGSKMDSKMIGYITAAVAAILVVLMIFMFSSGSGKLGGRTPEEAAENAISAMKDGDFKKSINNAYFESDEARTKALEQWNNLPDDAKNELAKSYSDMEIKEVKSINENRAKVELKGGGGTMNAKKVNGRWFIEFYGL